MHIYFKRAKSSEVTFGDATWNRELVAQHIDLRRTHGRDRPQLARGLGPESTMRVETGKVREFARAVKRPEPRVPGGRRRPGAADVPHDDRALDQDLGETRSAVKLDYRRLLHGEQEFEYVAADPGRRRADASGPRTKDVFEKQGKRGGTMTFILGETEFRNQRGEVVAYMRNTAIETADAVKE